MVIGDAVHNARAALDHLVWQLVLAAGNTPNRRTGFPVAEDDRNFRRAASALRGVPVKGPEGEARLSYTSGSVQVFSEDGIVVAIITR